MSVAALKLTSYFGERDRVAGRFLADALVDLYAERRVAVSLLLRGAEGFGLRHRLQTERLLSLSEDLPLVAIAVDARERIEAVAREVLELSGHGLVTLERARLLNTGESLGEPGAPRSEPAPPAGEPGTAAERSDTPADADALKLTAYLGRRQRPGHVALVELLRRRGLAGATVLLGVDGTVRGERRRAGFFAGNADVPLMAISVGEHERIEAVLPELRALLGDVPLTVERVRVLKRDGRSLATLPAPPSTDPTGLAVWQKLTIYAGEQIHSEPAGAPLHVEAIRRLREAGAAGATSVRGIWGYHGDHEPHGDRFWSLRRHVPMLTTIVDTPERMRALWPLIDELTAGAGLVTAELVPAARASAPERVVQGGLRLAPG